MGLNAYFTYQVVGYHGSGPVPYEVAVTAVFVEGFVFVGLSLLGLRQWLARAIPASIKLATGVAIGLFLSKFSKQKLVLSTRLTSSSSHWPHLQCRNRCNYWL
jgi:xanthine/uracil/vitamin C permease (AzgA family)